jgi:hypothetical protein
VTPEQRRAAWERAIRTLPPTPAIPPEWREKQKHVAPRCELEAGKDVQNVK